MGIKIFTLAIDDDQSTRAEVFTDEKSALIAKAKAMFRRDDEAQAKAIALIEKGGPSADDELCAFCEEYEFAGGYIDTYNVEGQNIDLTPRGMFGPSSPDTAPDPDEMNTQRADVALALVEAFAEDFGEVPGEDWPDEKKKELLEQNIRDLVADLMHLLDREGKKADEVIEEAKGYYTEEGGR